MLILTVQTVLSFNTLHKDGVSTVLVIRSFSVNMYLYGIYLIQICLDLFHLG